MWTCGDEVTGEWREVHNLCSSPLILRMMKPKRAKWGRHVARTEGNEYIQCVQSSGKHGGSVERMEHFRTSVCLHAHIYNNTVTR
jgi:hypothetical protein